MFEGEEDLGVSPAEPKVDGADDPVAADQLDRQSRGLYDFIVRADRPHYSDFLAVSQTMMSGYAKFAALGLPRNSIALAMLGGAINLYQLFNLQAELPRLLRSIADFMESESEPH